MLLDSNIVIYAVQPDHRALRKFIADHNPSVSAISYVEVLGYHNLEEQDRLYFEGFFHSTEMIDISEPILGQAISLRQQRKMSLGDALIAGTALIHSLTEVTHNVKDFEWVDDLEVLDPMV